MMAYAGLYYEEWRLNELEFIDKEIWKGWKDGIETAFSRSAFRQAWAILKKDTKYGDEFESFINKYV